MKINLKTWTTPEYEEINKKLIYLTKEYNKSKSEVKQKLLKEEILKLKKSRNELFYHLREIFQSTKEYDSSRGIIN
jgi:hypothetical protein